MTPKGQCRLALPAYRMVLDAGNGRLYAASTPAHRLQLSRMGDRNHASGDLLV